MRKSEEQTYFLPQRKYYFWRAKRQQMWIAAEYGLETWNDYIFSQYILTFGPFSALQSWEMFGLHKANPTQHKTKQKHLLNFSVYLQIWKANRSDFLGEAIMISSPCRVCLECSRDRWISQNWLKTKKKQKKPVHKHKNALSDISLIEQMSKIVRSRWSGNES